jgi:hypothetical protein
MNVLYYYTIYKSLSITFAEESTPGIPAPG